MSARDERPIGERMAAGGVPIREYLDDVRLDELASRVKALEDALLAFAEKYDHDVRLLERKVDRAEVRTLDIPRPTRRLLPGIVSRKVW